MYYLESHFLFTVLNFPPADLLGGCLVLTLEFFPTPMPHARKDFIDLYHMYLFSYLFFRLNSLYLFTLFLAQKLSQSFHHVFMLTELHLRFHHLCHVIRAFCSSLLFLYLTFTLIFLS